MRRRRWERVLGALAVAAWMAVTLAATGAEAQVSDPGAGERDLEDVREYLALNGVVNDTDLPSTPFGASKSGIPAAVDQCLSSVHLDRLFDTAYLDIAGYGAASDCESVFFLVVTDDVWFDYELDLFVVFVDHDDRAGTGCNGSDFAFAANYAAGRLQSLGISTPSCNDGTWAPLALQPFVARTDIDTIGLSIPVSVFPSSTFGWSLALESFDNRADFAPDTGFHRDRLSRPPAAAPALCFGSVPTIVAIPGTTTVGTAGNDVIMGTVGPDNIRGMAGDDKICSLAGNDIVEGGRGNDRIDLGAGADRAGGNRGADRILGRGGPDVIRGNTGADTLEGGQGHDRVFGGSGEDLLIGGGGRDSLTGEGGRDQLEGGPGADVLSGGARGDTLRGGGGDDELAGNAGSDNLLGGGGTDSCNGGRGDDAIAGCEN